MLTAVSSPDDSRKRGGPGTELWAIDQFIFATTLRACLGV